MKTLGKPHKMSSEVRCIECGETLNGAAEIGGDDRPVPGSISICIYCGHIAAFNDKLRLRPLTASEIHEIAGDPRVIAVQKAREIMLRNKG